MNIINKLTLNHMKKNKKRTIVTIIGVALAVALVTSVITILTSFVDFMKREEINNTGYWHVQYEEINKNQLDKIKTDENTENIMLSREIGFSNVEEIDNKTRPYIYVNELDDKSFESNNIKIKSGRLPKNQNEIVISEDIYNNKEFNYSLGDTLSLDLGKRYWKDKVNDKEAEINIESPFSSKEEALGLKVNKEYKIVGTIGKAKTSAFNPYYLALSYYDTNSSSESTAKVLLKNIGSKTYDNIDKFIKENNIKDYNTNSSLLSYSGAFKNDEGFIATIASLVIIVLGVISIGYISLIYNAFSISVSERTKYLGVLSSVGATKKQKRKTVLFEALIIYLISTPIGILIGLIGMGITFIFVNNIIGGTAGLFKDVRLELVINTIGIILILIISLLIIYISAIIPAIRVAKLSAIDAIRQSNDIKLNEKKIKTSRLTRKVFGIEADIALKNLKRNKSKYIITIFSMIISITLFISVSFFGDSIKKSINIYSKGVTYDICILPSVYGEGGFSDDFLDKEIVPVLNKSKEHSLQNIIGELIPVESSKIPEYLMIEPTEFKDVKDRKGVNATIISLDDKSFSKYIQDLGMAKSDFESNEDINGIYIDYVDYYDNESKKYTEGKSIEFKEEEKIEIGNVEGENQYKEISKINIIKTTDKLALGLSKPSDFAPIMIIVSEADIYKLLERKEKVFGGDLQKDISQAIYIKDDSPIKLQEDINIVKEKSSTDFFVNNVVQARESEEKAFLVVSIFLYGFIALVTLVSTANIFNTISTSIMLRRKEFAMLKSVGMSEKSFNKMINYESIFYGLKSLLYGLPIGILITLLMHKALLKGFNIDYKFPWMSIVIVIIGLLLILSLTMKYASSKIKKQSIIDILKQDNI